MVSHEELYNALKTIKQVCEENKNCVDCPLSAENHRCILRYEPITPDNWELQPPPPPVTYRPIEI